MTESVESQTLTEAREHEAEGGDFLSRLSLILGLTAIFVAAADIVITFLVHSGWVSAPIWTSQVQHVVPQLAVVLGAAGVALNLVGVWHLLARHRVFDPKDTQQDLALDDVAGLLSRVQQGCAFRAATSFGLVGALVAIVLSIWAVPFGNHFRVIGSNSAHTCSVSGTLAPFSLRLDNSDSTVSISWSATPVEMLANGAGWAQIVPAHGRLAAGQLQSITVFPNALVCEGGEPVAGALPRSTGALAFGVAIPSVATYHVRVSTAGSSTTGTVLAMGVQGQSASTVDAVPTATPVRTATTSPKSKPTATPLPRPKPTATPVRLPTATPIPPTPTATPCPSLAVSISKPINNQYFYPHSETDTVQFIGTITGGCSGIPTGDITWSVQNATYFPTPTVMGYGTNISYTLQTLAPTDSYSITFQVYDPGSGQTATSHISIYVQLFIG